MDSAERTLAQVSGLYPTIAVVDDAAVIDPVEARRLLDADENDRLLALVTPKEVGLAWCRYATRSRRAEGGLDWEADPDEFLATIADAAPDEPSAAPACPHPRRGKPSFGSNAPQVCRWGGFRTTA